MIILVSCSSIDTQSADLTPALLPETIQSTTSTSVEKVVSSTPEPKNLNVSLTGINEAGEEIYTSVGDLGVFSRFSILPERIAVLHFSTVPTTASNSEWRILVYRYRTDGIYSNQPAIEANLSTDVSINELKEKFGDCRAFTYQITDEGKNLQWEGYFSFNPDSILVNIDTTKAMKEGAVIGYPYSFDENEAAFFHNGKFIVINESQSGFYSLFYVFNFVLASGESSALALESIANELTLKLFSYREDGKYSVPIIEKSFSGEGIIKFDLPIDFLRQNNGDKYYLQIVGGKGNTVKD